MESACGTLWRAAELRACGSDCCEEISSDREFEMAGSSKGSRSGKYSVASRVAFPRPRSWISCGACEGRREIRIFVGRDRRSERYTEECSQGYCRGTFVGRCAACFHAGCC